MPSQTVELIFKIQTQNTASLNELKQVVSGIAPLLQKQLELTNLMLIRGTEQIRQNNELIQSIRGRSTAQAQANESTSGAILKGIIYNELLNRTLSLVKSVTVESALYAARTQQLNVVMDQLARTNNLSVTAVRQQADAIKNLGITTQESREVINRMIFAQLDLSKATDLARLSQNAAKIAGVNSSEALQGIINGIIEQRVQVLRTYGVQVQFESALIRGAAALNKTRETLTDAEKANIALNEVLSKGPRIMGVYEVSLSTAAGQLQSMKRYTDEARNALGEGFLPILQRVVEGLTDASKSVAENAEAYQKLALHVTAAGAALLAARLIPGWGGVIAGGAAALGVEVLGDIDPVEQQQKFSGEAIIKIQNERRENQQKFDKGTITDKAQAIKEDQRLKDLQLEVEKNFTDELARIFKDRQNSYLKANAKAVGPLAEQDRRKVLAFENPSEVGAKTGIPSSVNLPLGFNVSRQAILNQIAERSKPLGDIDLAGLKTTPNPVDAVGAISGQFDQKAREAIKTAEGGLDRAKASLLNGSDKIEQDRKSALDKLALEFKSFNDTLAKAKRDAGQVKDPKDRQELLQNIKIAQGQYGTAVAKTNQQFDIELQLDKRKDAVEEIQRNKRVFDANFEVQSQATRADISSQERIARATRSTPGNEETDINKVYQDRIKLAQQDRADAETRNVADLEAATKIFALTNEDKVFKDAQAANSTAEIKAQGELTKEISAAEVDRQVAILELRHKQRTELAESLTIARDIAKEDANLNIKRTRDSAGRSVTLAQAQAQTPAESIRAANLGIQERLQAAADEYKQAQLSRQEQNKASLEAYLQTGDKIALEKSAGEIRKQELHAAYDLEKEISDLRLEKELQVAEVRKQQAQELRGMLGKLYDDISTKNGGGARAFLKDMADELKKQIFVNVGSIALKGIIPALGGIVPGQQQIDPATGKPTGQLTPLGQVLQGTILGVDPAKLAQAQQVKAVDRNTRALDDLTDILTGKTPGSSPSLPGGGGGSRIGNNPGAWGGWSGGAAESGGILGTLFGGLRKAIGGANGGYSNNFISGGSAIDVPDFSSGAGPTGLPSWGGTGLPGWGGSSSPSGTGGSPGGTGSGGFGGLGSLIGLIPSKSPAITGTAQTAALRDIFKHIPSLTGPGGILGPKTDPNTGKPVFSLGQTALAAATALPQIIGGFKQGGAGGILTGIGGILGAAASIPSPASPFLAAGSAVLSLLGPLFGKSKYQQWQKDLNNRLASKFQTPASINLTQDLAGNSADFDYLGNLRTYGGNPSSSLAGNGPAINVHVQTMDSRSFMDNSAQIANAVKQQMQLGHPINTVIQGLANS